MGGNTKIAIEMARHLPKLGWSVVVVVPKGKLETFTDNIQPVEGLSYSTIEDFHGSEFRRFAASARHAKIEIGSVFRKLGVNGRDIVFATCNFHFEILSLVLLKRKYGFRYLPSHFLFSPFLFENILRGYRFPAFKYLLVWFYERTFFLLAKCFADGFVITNDADRCHFPRRMKNRLFAFYGGVNTDQIPNAPAGKTRDVVFCSRLHPQKGIEGLLEIWAIVCEKRPSSRLTVIGNGDASYEKRLREKAVRLGIADRVEWLGYVNNEAKYAIYRSAKAFAHSTVFDNNGMVAAEALCSGLPVVMYDLPALRHVYAAGCMKVPYGDKTAFADALLRLVADEDFNGATAPSPDQIADLREHWDWSNRVKSFAAWLEVLHG